MIAAQIKMNTISAIKRRGCFSVFLYLTMSKGGQIMAAKTDCFCKF